MCGLCTLPAFGIEAAPGRGTQRHESGDQRVCTVDVLLHDHFESITGNFCSSALVLALGAIWGSSWTLNPWSCSSLKLQRPGTLWSLPRVCKEILKTSQEPKPGFQFSCGRCNTRSSRNVFVEARRLTTPPTRADIFRSGFDEEATMTVR